MFLEEFCIVSKSIWKLCHWGKLNFKKAEFAFNLTNTEKSFIAQHWGLELKFYYLIAADCEETAEGAVLGDFHFWVPVEAVGQLLPGRHTCLSLLFCTRSHHSSPPPLFSPWGLWPVFRTLVNVTPGCFWLAFSLPNNSWRLYFENSCL